MNTRTILLILWLNMLWANPAYPFQPTGTTELTLNGLNYSIDLVADDQYLYVADAMNLKIMVYNYRGEHVREIGRDGRGPGEFSKLLDLALCGNRLYALDHEINKVVVFNKENGEPIQEILLDKVPMRSPGSIQCKGQQLNIGYDHSFVQGQLDMDRNKLVAHVNDRGSIIDTLAFLDAQEWLLNKMEGGFGVQPMPFRRDGIYAVSSNYVISNNNRGPKIEVRDTTGKNLNDWTIPSDPSQVTLGMRTRETNLFHVLKRSIAQSDQEMHEYLPYTDAILLDGNHFYVQRNWKSKDNTIYQGTVGTEGLVKITGIDDQYQLLDITATHFIVAKLGFMNVDVKIIPKTRE
ncbi:MAG: 6-bladed beta-propeller [Bacteroidota bacterium]